MSNINCPFHDDQTASLAVYSDGFWCFACGAKGSVKDLEKEVPNISATPFQRSYGSYKEDIPKALERINALPKKLIRGLELPYDDISYYIVYPNAKYYLRRFFKPGKNKYFGPKGATKPLMEIRYGSYASPDRGDLLVVEGQINTLSAAKALGYDGPIRMIVSPGGANDLNRPKAVEYCLQYTRVGIIVDKDAAGVVAALQLRDRLLARGIKVVIHAMERDLNDLLVDFGEEEVRKEVNKALALLSS